MTLPGKVVQSAAWRSVIFAVAVSVLGVIADGCSRAKGPLVGTWKADSGAIFDFRADGRCKVGGGKYPASGTYTLAPGVINIQLDDDSTKTLLAVEWKICL